MRDQDMPSPSPSREREGSEKKRRPPKPYTRWTAETERAFFLALRLTGNVLKACAEIGRSSAGVYRRRKISPAFAEKWDAAIAEQQAEWIAYSQAVQGPADDGEGGGRLAPGWERPDGWTKERRGAFLRALSRTRCVREACLAADMDDTSAYRLRQRSVRFARAWDKALLRELPSVKEAAYARAVEGWTEPVMRGGEVVGERWRYSDGLLRDLLRAEISGAMGRDADRQARQQANRARGHYSKEGYQARCKAEREETNRALLKAIEAAEKRVAMKKAQEDAAGWARWRECWGSLGRAGQLLALPAPEGAGEPEPRPQRGPLPGRGLLTRL